MSDPTATICRMLWTLNYYLDDPSRPRSTEIECDDLAGDNIRIAHERVRDVSEGRGILRRAVRKQTRDYSEDPLVGTPTQTLWITYVPYVPDHDTEEHEQGEQVKEAFEFPEKLFQMSVTAEGEVQTEGPNLGEFSLAIRRRLGDGREGSIVRISHTEDD